MVSVGNNNTCKGGREKGTKRRKRSVEKNLEEREKRGEKEEEKNSLVIINLSIIKREISDLALENKLED